MQWFEVILICFTTAILGGLSVFSLLLLRRVMEERDMFTTAVLDEMRLASQQYINGFLEQGKLLKAQSLMEYKTDFNNSSPGPHLSLDERDALRDDELLARVVKEKGGNHITTPLDKGNLNGKEREL